MLLGPYGVLYWVDAPPNSPVDWFGYWVGSTGVVVVGADTGLILSNPVWPWIIVLGWVLGLNVFK